MSDTLSIVAAVAAILAVFLISAEWMYVVLWTRRFGKTVVGGVLRKVLTLRTGRGKNPPAPEAIANAAEEMDNADAENPTVSEEQVDAFVGEIARRTGIPVDTIRTQGAKFFPEFFGGGDGGRGLVPSGARGAGAPPTGDPMEFVGAIIQDAITGKVDWKAAAAAAVPYFLKGGFGNQAGNTGQAGGYW